MLNFNGGSEVIYPKSFGENEEVILPTSSSKLGYIFAGWYDNNSFLGRPIDKIPAGTTSDQIYYAKWDIISYTITYILNGGTIETSFPTSFTIEDEIILPIPINVQYQFVGWYKNSDFSGNSINCISKGTIGNQIFYAKWEIIDVDDFCVYMNNQLPNIITEDINLPINYHNLTIS